jgi:hypothetical protein
MRRQPALAVSVYVYFKRKKGGQGSREGGRRARHAPAALQQYERVIERKLVSQHCSFTTVASRLGSVISFEPNSTPSCERQRRLSKLIEGNPEARRRAPSDRVNEEALVGEVHEEGRFAGGGVAGDDEFEYVLSARPGSSSPSSRASSLLH